MKHFFRLAAFLTLCFFSVPESFAADKYWVGGTGNWSDTTHWSLTSGGAGSAGIPGVADNACFDSASTGTATMDQAFTILSLDFSGTSGGGNCAGASGSKFVGTFVQNNFNLTITGSVLKFACTTPPASPAASCTSGMTYTQASPRPLIIGPATTTTITTANLLMGAVTFGVVTTGIGTATLADNFNTRTDATITHLYGTIDAATNNVNVSTPELIGNNANTRTLNCGTGTWTFTAPSGGGAYLDFTVTSALALNCASSTFAIIGSNNFFHAITLNAPLSGTGWGTFAFTGVSSTSGQNNINFVAAANITLAGLTATGSLNISFVHGKTITLTNAPVFTGTAAKPILIYTDNPNTNPAGFTFSTTGTPTHSQWVAYQCTIFSGGVTFVSDNSFDLGCNSGFTINVPTTGGGGGHIIGG